LVLDQTRRWVPAPLRVHADRGCSCPRHHFRCRKGAPVSLVARVLTPCLLALSFIALSTLTVASQDTTSNVEIRVWQSTENAKDLYVSARPEGGSWRALGTIELLMDQETDNERFRYSDITLAVPVIVDELEYEEDGKPILAYTDGGKVTQESDGALACFEALEWLTDEIWGDEWDATFRTCSGHGGWRHAHRAGFIATGIAVLSHEDAPWYEYYRPFYVSSIDGVVYYRLWPAEDLSSLTRAN